MHLAYARYINDGEQVLHFYLRTGFLIGFPGCAFGQGFAHFHEARRQGPKAFARLDVSFAQQDLVLPHRNSADHVQRVFVMHGVTRRADRPQSGVAVIRQALTHSGAAVFAMFD